MFDKSAAAVKGLVDACQKIAPDLGKSSFKPHAALRDHAARRDCSRSLGAS